MSFTHCCIGCFVLRCVCFGTGYIVMVPLKGLHSGRVTHLNRFFSKNLYVLVTKVLSESTLLVGTFICPLSMRQLGLELAR